MLPCARAARARTRPDRRRAASPRRGAVPRCFVRQPLRVPAGFVRGDCPGSPARRSAHRDVVRAREARHRGRGTVRHAALDCVRRADSPRSHRGSDVAPRSRSRGAARGSTVDLTSARTAVSLPDRAAALPPESPMATCRRSATRWRRPRRGGRHLGRESSVGDAVVAGLAGAAEGARRRCRCRRRAPTRRDRRDDLRDRHRRRRRNRRRRPRKGPRSRSCANRVHRPFSSGNEPLRLPALSGPAGQWRSSMPASRAART